jgi:phosphopantothenoylcysteine decarboxylase/phosphopantothenate--cysteine ligase
MQGKRIVLGVTGGIAAYKSPDLVRRLRERGAEVQVVMTQSAGEFITATTFQAVSGRPVRTDLWDPAAEAAMGHIELARWADLVIVAPATADFLGWRRGAQTICSPRCVSPPRRPLPSRQQ